MTIKNLFKFCIVGLAATTSVANADIKAEANSVGLDFIKRQILNCDGQLFIKYQWGTSDGPGSWLQLLEPRTMLLIAKPPSSVDKLNGVEWRGGMKLFFKAVRSLYAPSTYDPKASPLYNASRNSQTSAKPKWSEWTTNERGITIFYSKVNGNWVNESSPLGFFVEPGTCEDIPLIPSKVNSTP